MWRDVAWDASREAFIAAQEELGREHAEPWRPEPGGLVAIGAVFVCFGRGGSGPGAAGDRGWAAAVVGHDHQRFLAFGSAEGLAPAGYEPGLLGRREGPLLEEAVRQLRAPPDVLPIDATGRDHPRRAGLALHLGAVLGLPTVGVTHRPLLARGEEPGPETGARSPLRLDGELVGYWLRTRQGTKPLAIHAAWRTDPEMVAEVVLRAGGPFRTPTPLRAARRLARSFRSTAGRGFW